MVKRTKKSQISELSEPIPELKCVRMPTKGLNNGEYSVTIPLKYMVSAYKYPAAFFVFKFVGMKGDIINETI